MKTNPKKITPEGKRFLDFTKALVSVPKSEIEDKAKAYERKKKPRTRKK